MFNLTLAEIFFFGILYRFKNEHPLFTFTLFITIKSSYFLTGHETEISFFKKEDYDRYKANPVLKW